jgi:hypothetical protein
MTTTPQILWALARRSVLISIGTKGLMGKPLMRTDSTQRDSNYMDINEDWQGAKDPISTHAANRIMRDNILAQIPRHSQWPIRSSSS